MSWESSLEYYRLINKWIKDEVGWLHSAKSLMYSVDFSEIEQLQHQWNWQEAERILIDAGKRLERGGADFVVICTNTMHKLADAVQMNIGIPLLHIADATAEEIKKHNLKRIGLLGTKFTMEQDFYKGRLHDKYWLDVIIPSSEERDVVHDIIYNELCLGKIYPTSKDAYMWIIKNLISNWAEAVILGCTEISLLIDPENTEVMLFDTTRIHAKYAVEYSLK